MASEALFQSLAESVADGRPVDWDSIESQAAPREREIVRQLRVVANLSQLHRSLPDVPASPAHRMPSLSVPALGVWGHLSVIERLGGGAFADVFRAWDRELEREVALKLLRGEPDNTDPVSSRIADEGRLLARVRHPNVVTVYGVATHQRRVGLWMELVHGETLESQLHARGPLGAKEAAVVGIELCRALAAIHKAGLVHRDVKAQNVMREQGGRIVLMDLGTGREVDPAAPGPARIAGTPLYLAPEVLTGAPATPQTDLYSLGVLLYRLVTGSFPASATTIEELHARHQYGRVVPLRDVRPDLPAAFVQVIDRAISADPARRYASAGSLEADLARAIEERPEGAWAAERGTPAKRRWPALVAVAAVLAIAVGLGLWFRGRTASRPGAVPAGSVHAIAVLPLENLSGDASQDYFAAGMTDELIGTLGRLQGLNVISSTSVAPFKDSKTPLPEIARTLDVDAIVEGSVFVQPGSSNDTGPAGRRVRVNARLIYAGTGTQLWNQTFEAAMSDVLTIQSRIATAVARGISLRLSEQQRVALAADSAGGSAQDPVAFDLYLHGRYYWNTRTEEGFRRAIQYFQEAIDRDPKSARAYAGLADAYSLLGVYDMMPRAEAEAAALAAATKAVALDDSLAEAHASIGYIRLQAFDWKAAESELRRAIALKPSYAAAHRWYATWLAKQGRLPEALTEMKTALDQDPLSAGANGVYGMLLMLQRKYDEALLRVQKALQLDPAFSRARMLAAEVYALQRQYPRALAEAERAAAAAPKDLEVLADLGYIRAVAGRRADAVRVRDELVRRASANEDAAAGGVAIIYVGLGDADRAFEWLGRARDRRDPWIGYLKVDPRFDRLRSDPRFTGLLASVGLAQ